MTKERKNCITLKKYDGTQIPPSRKWLKREKKERDITAFPCLAINKGCISSPALIDLLKSEKGTITRA